MATPAIDFKAIMAPPAIDLDYELDCICGDASIQIKNIMCTGDALFFCKHCNKTKKLSGKIYCRECGPFFHRYNKKGHQFDIYSENVVAVKRVLEAKEDAARSSWGKQVMISMIGVERYSKIAPMVDNFPVVYSCGIGGITLFAELTEHFASNTVSKFATQNVVLESSAALVVATIAEVGLHAYRWGKGQISGKEFVRQVGRVVTKNVATFGVIVAAGKVGAIVGSATCPVVGTVVGFLGGLLLGLIAGKQITSLYDKMFPDGEEVARKNCVKEALSYFHYQPKDIHNSAIFNTNDLTRRFKRFALDAHPDKRGGDHAEWYILSQHYGLLKSLCNQTKNTKKMVNKALVIE